MPIIELSINDLKRIAKGRGIKGYKNMSGKKLLSVFSKLKINNERLKKISEDLNRLRHKYSKSEINEIRKILYEISSKKKLLIEKRLSALKKYFNHADAKYIGIKNVGSLFNRSTDKGYYEPIKTKSAFNSNYIEYWSNGDKDKGLLAKTCHNRIRPYLSNIINDYQASENFKVHSDNEVSDYKTQFGKWKI